MTGMWALVIFRRASMDFISGYRIQGKFFVFQVLLKEEKNFYVLMNKFNFYKLNLVFLRSLYLSSSYFLKINL